MSLDFNINLFDTNIINKLKGDIIMSKVLSDSIVYNKLKRDYGDDK
jgi:hypothetical protein